MWIEFETAGGQILINMSKVATIEPCMRSSTTRLHILCGDYGKDVIVDMPYDKIKKMILGKKREDGK